MIPTPFGLVIIVVGLLLLLRGSLTAMLGMVIVATLFGGSAAVALPALGGSTIPPAHLSLVFLLLRALLPGPGQMAGIAPAISANAFLVVFCVYAAVSAMFLPVIFAGGIEVTPLRPGRIRHIYEVAPLAFSSQNITTMVYMLGTLAAALGAYAGAARPGSAATIARVGTNVALAHAALGFISIAVAGTPFDAIIEFFRNGRYAQLDQTAGGIARMAGIWPEASGFAAYGGGLMIFMTELWLRDVLPRRTGFAAAILALALLISTSSTAYVTLSGYSAILAARAVLAPGSIGFAKVTSIGAALLLLVTVGLMLITFSPTVFATIVKVLAYMTIEKGDSASGLQRLFWAQQGISAFAFSWGLGIGAGSFRSSSLITAIIGSLGVVGTFAFAAHMLRALKPLRHSTYYPTASGRESVGAAASWTTMLMLMPAAVGSPTCDPGIVWGMFSGIALGMRAAPIAAQATRRTGAPPRSASTAPLALGGTA